MSDTNQFSRRQMLLGSAVIGAATASAGSAGTEIQAPESAAEDHHRVVLKDTPHTRTYYALARS